MAMHSDERRNVLRAVFAAACALGVVPGVWAAERTAQKPAPAPGGKLSKAQAQYQDQPKGDQMCANCLQFIPASSTCRVVEGKVSPQGWSILWAKKA